MADQPFASRGEERFVLRPRRRGGFEIVRQVDDIEFQGEPFWVDRDVIAQVATREEARRFMLERSGS